MGKFLFPIHRALSVTLLMPLFIQVFRLVGIGLHLNVLLLFLISLYMLSIALFNYKKIGIGKISIAFLVFFLLSIIQILSLSRILPILFFFQCFLLALFIHHDNFANVVLSNKRLISFVTILYIAISLLLLVLHLNFNPVDGRFYGLAYSPTTFVLFLVVLLVLFHYVYKSSFTFHVLFGLSIVLTYFSGTRTGLLLLILLPLNNYFYDKYLHGKKWIRIVLFLFIMAIYPLAEFITITNPELVEYRFADEGEVDYSYATRIAFTTAVADEWVQGSTIQKIFGFGTEFSRMKILNLYDEDIQLHNDFLRFAVDFGLPAMLLFIAIIFSLSQNNKYSFFLALIYLFSFYHNMIYEVFLFNTLLFLNRASTEKILTA